VKIDAVLIALELLLQAVTLLAVFVVAWINLTRRLTRVEVLLETLQRPRKRIHMVERPPMECEGKH
jgi:hypothetical protein